MRLALAMTLALMGCDEEPKPDPDPGACDQAKVAALEVSHYGTFAELDDIVYCGIPPQGGAPYAPFGLRVRGVEPTDTGVIPVTITATDTTSGEVVGMGEFNERFLCANAGESDGWFVGAEFHLRFSGYELSELHEREIEISFEAEGLDGLAEMAMVVDLDCVAGS